MHRISHLELNDQFKYAIELMEGKDKNIFITGKAGTGKSTLLDHFCNNTKKSPVILAPTGVAALNVKGQTIHSFFNFYIDVTVEKIKQRKVKPRETKLYSKIKTIIIDEVSMLRADLLDCIDTFLQLYGPKPKKRFGGVQMIFIGDLYQLPPVVTSQEKEIFTKYYKTPYFFSTHAFSGFDIEVIELEKVYRQKDEEFIDLLNKIRNNSVIEDDIRHLNSRVLETKDKEFYINLTTLNKKADEINDKYLKELKGKLYTSDAEIKGNFSKEYFPTSTELRFKRGCQVMLLNNDSKREWVNGSIGIIEEIRNDNEGIQYLRVRLKEDNKIVFVYQHTWQVYKFSYDGNTILSEAIGKFIQYPFRLAWAITIHKSQGKTFDNMMIDIGSGTFVAGQMYVALSRCTSFEGIVLKTPIKKHHIRTDYRIFDFLTSYQYRKAAEEFSLEDKIELIKKAINSQASLEITYPKANDTKSNRIVIPIAIGIKNFQGKTFNGMKAFCTSRQEERMFRIDRILKINLRLS